MGTLFRIALVGSIATLFGCGTAADEDGGASRPADYIRNAGFSRLVIEVDTVPGLSPRSGVTDKVRDVLQPVVDKPDGILFVFDETDIESANTYGNGDGVWTFSELKQLARAQASLSLEAGEIDLLTMWVDGEYEDSSVLGIAWGQRFIAIFAERIAQSCNVVTLEALLCPLAEATIWTHEIGHVIGLVDNGTPMVNDHRDPDHGKHDISDESVMFWTYDGVGVMDTLQARLLGDNEDVIPWGEECLNDLEAAR